MSALEAMLETLDNPAEFQRATMTHYRAVLLDMMQNPLYVPHKTALFVALRTITEWQRASTEDFQRFYEDYQVITREIDNVVLAVDEARRERIGI